MPVKRLFLRASPKGNWLDIPDQTPSHRLKICRSQRRQHSVCSLLQPATLCSNYCVWRWLLQAPPARALPQQLQEAVPGDHDPSAHRPGIPALTAGNQIPVPPLQSLSGIPSLCCCFCFTFASLLCFLCLFCQSFLFLSLFSRHSLHHPCFWPLCPHTRYLNVMRFDASVNRDHY